MIGALAGLVTGLGSALIALRIAKAQDASAQELQRRRWRADTLRTCYSEVGGTHRQFMMEWLAWWDELNGASRREQYAGLMRAATAFATACTAVRIYAPESVVEPLMNLRKLTFAFDEYADRHRDLKAEEWKRAQEAKYEQLRVAADDAMLAFIRAARDSIEEVLNGIVG